MGRFRTGNLVEAGLWLALVLVLYIYSFEFDRDIEIYRYGATAWPRAILLLIAVAAIGQLLSQAKNKDETPSGMFAAAADDAAVLRVDQGLRLARDAHAGHRLRL